MKHKYYVITEIQGKEYINTSKTFLSERNNLKRNDEEIPYIIEDYEYIILAKDYRGSKLECGQLINLKKKGLLCELFCLIFC